MMLYKHQEEAARFILGNRGVGALFHSIGTGKTLTTLTIFMHIRKRYPETKLYVICPISLIDAAWGEDIGKFTNYTYHSLRNKKHKEADIYIVNYEWLLRNDIKPAGKAMIAIDESSKIKNFKALTTKKLLSINNRFDFRVIMSGTPAPNCETEYWAQMMFLNDTIFHRSFYGFRNTYFHLSRGSQMMQGKIVSKIAAKELFSKGWKYDILPKNREALLARMKPYCHYAHKKDCLDLPEQIDQVRSVFLTAELMKIYRDMKEQCVAEISGGIVATPIALTKIMKLRQITSGFAINEKGEVLAAKSNPKLKELMSVLEEIGDQQVIIWCQFRYEIRQLAELLNAVTLYGETKDRNDSIQRFKSGESQYLIAHPRSAGHGLTLTNSSIQIFYSLDYSWEAYTQCRGRTHRAGQKNPCTYIHLIAKNTIDEVVLNVLRRKGNAQDVLRGFMK